MWSCMGSWVRHGKVAAVVLAVFLALAPVTLAGCSRGGLPPASSGQISPGAASGVGSKPAEAPVSSVTGEPMTSQGSPVAVSIDNYPNARPESGLAQADVVYEALTEGGITRYLAIFHSHAPSVVGPVRSARPYFALLAKEWGAVFAHCGGDPKDIEPIREWNVVDADEFKHGDLYWRDNTREAPHNLYTSIEHLRKVTSDPLPAPAKRYDFGSWAADPVFGIEVRYSKNYAVQYRYADKRYERWILDGDREPWAYSDRDTGDKPEIADVIVQFAKTRVAYSDGGVIIDLIGEGKAVYLLGGSYAEGTWKKASVEEPTLFYTQQGTRITLVPGQTWVQIAPEDATVRVLQGK